MKTEVDDFKRHRRRGDDRTVQTYLDKNKTPFAFLGRGNPSMSAGEAAISAVGMVPTF